MMNSFLPFSWSGDHVAMNDSGNFEDTASITKIINDRNGFVIVLDKAIAGLKVGDALFEVIEGTAEGESKGSGCFPYRASARNYCGRLNRWGLI